MNQEITKDLMCILMRAGVEIWLENEKLETLLEALETKRFVQVSGRLINVADVSGIFSAKDMKERWYRKNGYWECDKKEGFWHKKDETCGHK